MGTFHNDAFSSTLRIVVFPFGKIDNRFFRRVCHVKGFEYPTEYVCYGVTVEDADTNTDNILLQRTKGGAVYADVACHEATHAVLNVHARLHQKILTEPGSDEFTASLMGCAFNTIYAMLVRYRIPMIVG